MRVKDPEGEWIAVPGEPRLMKRADWAKGEKGVWKLYPEGLDNDGDGQINEDGPGGVNVGTAFPHLFKYHAPDAGAWSGSEPETFALLQVLRQSTARSGSIFVFGESSYCLNPPRGRPQGRRRLQPDQGPRARGRLHQRRPHPDLHHGRDHRAGQAARPARHGGHRGPRRRLPRARGGRQSARGGPQVLQGALRGLQGVPQGRQARRQAPRPGARQGRLARALCLLPPRPALLRPGLLDPARGQGGEAGRRAHAREAREDDQRRVHRPGRGEGRRLPQGRRRARPVQGQAGLRGAQGRHDGHQENGRDDEADAQEADAEGEADPKEKALLAWSDKELGGKGFVAWKPFKHPTLGDVEIGGAAPFADNTPPAKMIDGLLKGQVPWVFEVSKKMARIGIADAKVKKLGSAASTRSRSGSRTRAACRTRRPWPAATSASCPSSSPWAGRASTSSKARSARSSRPSRPTAPSP
ncbi:MAG: hypothetical protein M0C28_32465 [Candidatus Moduliflexus flocculans]|nr:hypothetical protein [Candidatus Moduliflexus flocculans]